MVGEESKPADDPAGRAGGGGIPSKVLHHSSTVRGPESRQETPANSSVASTAPPDFIDHFEIRRLLGYGGFGSVFLAHDTKLDRMVALKLLDKLDKQAARRMLADETRAASQLRHPHLVTVFQCGEHPRGCYIVFEHIPGPDRQQARTLREVLKEKQRLPPAEAVSIARHIAAALTHAHLADVVHRDIKPENILLDDKGSAFLADFGCARRSRRHAVGVRSLVGTFPYMSLEQIEGRWNAQTDIWSLGVVLYEMLQGTRPFAFAEKTKSRGAAEATFSFAAAIVGMQQLPPIAGVDPDLNAICRKCLQIDPDHRYESASALAEDLTRWQRNEPVLCRRVGVIEQTRRWAQRNPLVASLLTALVMVLAIGFGGSTYFAFQMWTARQGYVDEQLTQLDQLDSANFAAAISNLQREPFRRIAIQSLASRWQNSGGTPRNEKLQNRMAAAIVTMQRAEAEPTPDSALAVAARERLFAALLTTKSPDEFLLIRGYAKATSSPQAPDTAKLWETAQDASDPDKQFRALSALTDYDPGGEMWTGLAKVLALRLLDQNGQEIAGWARSVLGLADRLVPCLKAELNANNEARKTRAAIAYAILANTPQELAKRIKTEPSPGVVRELLLQIKGRVESAQQALQLLEPLDVPPANATARQLANLSVCRLSLCGGEVRENLPMFQPGGDPLARYLFEMDAATYGLAPNSLLNWIAKLQSGNSSAEATQTAVLAMGSTDLAELPSDTRQPIVEKVTSIYRGHESARVHAAAERVLRQWNVKVPIIASADQPYADDSWRINKVGQLMVRVTLPQNIPAEITAHEITLGDYMAYVRARAAHYGLENRVLSWIREPIKRHLNETAVLGDEASSSAATNPEDKLTEQQLPLPVRHISALQSVAYCVWVSQVEGIADDQLAFQVREGLQKQNESLLQALERQLGQISSPLQTCVTNALGYRLPLSDEWEFLFADPCLVRLTGKLRDEFGWYRGNSQLEIHPVGMKHPQRRGVFDAWGNVTEWTIASLQETHVQFETLGSSYESQLEKLRPITPQAEVFGGHRAIGFRIMRTLD